VREDGTYFGKDSWSDFKPGWLIEFCETNPEAGPKVWIRMSLSILALFCLATSLHILFDLIQIRLFDRRKSTPGGGTFRLVAEEEA
jgi:hypothetical protein